MCTGCAARHSKARMPHKLGMTSPKRPPGGGRPLPGLGPGGTFLPVLFEIGGWFRQRCPSRLAVLLEHPAREVERAADEDAGAGGAGGDIGDGGLDRGAFHGLQLLFQGFFGDARATF